MKTINIVVGQTPQSYGIVIGRRGENEATQLVFDVSSLISTYGSGTAVLMAKRPTDISAYPVTVTQDGATVTWTVTDADTAYKGRGECELFWYVGDVLAKSVVYRTTIGKDIGTTTEEPPDAYESWVETLTGLAAETQQSATDAAQSASDAAASAAEITGMTAQAETLPAGAEASADYSDGVLSIGVPRGADGADGYSPTITVTDIPGGHRVTITDADGTHTFDVMDGSDGGSSSYTFTDPNGDGNIIITEVG